jgi:hypothetical protein
MDIETDRRQIGRLKRGVMDRWTDRQMDKKLAERGRQTVGQTHRHGLRELAYRQTDRKSHRHIYRLTKKRKTDEMDGRTERIMDRHTYGQADRRTDKQKLNPQPNKEILW